MPPSLPKAARKRQLSPLPWRELREPFDHSLARTRAICLRGGDSDLSMVSLCSAAEHGYAWQGTSRRIGHSYEPDVRVRVGTVFFGSPNGNGEAMRDFPRFLRNRFGPDIIERELEYPVLSLAVRESLFRTPEADYAWHSTWSRDAYRGSCPLQVTLLVEIAAPFEWEFSSRNRRSLLSLRISREGELPFHLAVAHPKGEAITCEQGSGPRTLALTLKLDFGLHDVRELEIAMSCRSGRAATVLLDGKKREKALRAVERDWDRYLARRACPDVPRGARALAAQLSGQASRQPRPFYLDAEGKKRPQAARPAVDDRRDLTDEDYRQALSKGLWHTRTCERTDPIWGQSLTETFTCYYTGTFPWSVPVVGFYARSGNGAKASWVRKVLECYREAQRPDGSFPGYVPFHWKPQTVKPSSHIQIPQLAWAIWQEYRGERDRRWLANWYEPLVRFAEYMRARDAQHLGLGLWCQTHYYDGLDMFPTVDGLVIRREPVLYSAVMASEQVRYLSVLARIARRSEPDRAADWERQAEVARKKMEALLWDRSRQWYGDILANGKRETVVGMCALYAAAYGLFPAACDRRRVRANLESLIAPYGVATVAPRDRRYSERFFWRGPVWPASCLYGAGAALRYAPDLLPRIAAATVRFAQAQPNVWECLEAHSGQVASYDEGVAVMPGTSSVVGAYALVAALRICAGEDLFSLESRPRKAS